MVRVFDNQESISQRLQKLARGESMPWTEVSQLLDQVEKTKYWEQTASSFTEWLKSNAEKLGNKESTLWRYLVVGRYYHDLREQFKRVKLDYPPLLELPKHVSPEKLELLAKLGRVAPKDFFEKLIYDVLDNTVTRDDIREQWKAFRPALKGKTARGRGALMPRVNINNKDEYKSVREALIINALKAFGPSWLGSVNPQMYEVRMHVEVSLSLNRRNSRLFDAVILHKESTDKNFEVHIIETAPRLMHPKNKLDTYHEIAEYCDYVWVATHADPTNIIDKFMLRKSYPDFVGMLVVDDAEVSVTRQATRCDKDYEKANDLLTVLLIKGDG